MSRLAWNDDPPGSEQLIETNIRALGNSIIADAAARPQFRVAMVQDWHRAIFRNVSLPVTYYAGEVRDSDPSFPELIGYEVAVGAALGVPSQQVPMELVRFEQSLQGVMAQADSAILPGRAPTSDIEVAGVIRLLAWAHGEWVRIHPFANGNGRTARVLANWLAARYGLPMFVRVRPRPDGVTYGAAAAASMQGDHRLAESAFFAMLNSHIP